MRPCRGKRLIVRCDVPDTAHCLAFDADTDRWQEKSTTRSLKISAVSQTAVSSYAMLDKHGEGLEIMVN